MKSELLALALLVAAVAWLVGSSIAPAVMTRHSAAGVVPQQQSTPSRFGSASAGFGRW